MKKIYLLHPLLFALYPIIFLYSHNVQEVRLQQAYMPIEISLVGTAILWGLLILLIRNRAKATLITTLYLMSFFSYGYLFNSITALNFFTVNHRHLLPLVLFLVGYISYFIYITKRQELIDQFNKIICIVTTILIIINLFIIVPNEVEKFHIAKQNELVQKVKTSSPTSNNYPDIYYIVLDEYASFSTIKSQWNYDYSWFIKSLKDRGFYVAENSKVKYNSTMKAIPAYLNMNYLPDNKGLLYSYQKMSNNKVVEFLKDRGYKYIYFGNWFDINRYKMNADYQFNYLIDSDKSYLDNYSLTLIKSTMMKPFLYYFQINQNSNIPEANAVIYAFNKLKKVPQMNVGAPKFVFAHILSPHSPFVLNQQGGLIEAANWYNWKDKNYYLDQHIYVTKQLDQLINVLQKQSQKPPIIIIQSDHGPRPMYGPNPDQRLQIPDEEMFKILNAYYLPDFDMKLLNNEISPINTFRLIFNHYFNGNFKILDNNVSYVLVGDNHEDK